MRFNALTLIVAAAIFCTAPSISAAQQPVLVTWLGESSAPANHPEAQSLGSSFLYGPIVGCGASVDYKGAGSMLTESFPRPNWASVDRSNIVLCDAAAKDHWTADPSVVVSYAITLPAATYALYDVMVFFTPYPVVSDEKRITETRLVLKDYRDWTMASGGCLVNWGKKKSPQPPGALLTASYPFDVSTWVCRAQDHLGASPHTLQAFIVAIRPKSQTTQQPVACINRQSSSVNGPSRNKPVAQVGNTCNGGQGVVTGGGAEAISDTELWSGAFPMKSIFNSEVAGVAPPPITGDRQRWREEIRRELSLRDPDAPRRNGQFLTASMPTFAPGGTRPNGWEARSKDHLVASPGHVTAYSISVRF